MFETTQTETDSAQKSFHSHGPNPVKMEKKLTGHNKVAQLTASCFQQPSQSEQPPH